MKKLLSFKFNEHITDCKIYSFIHSLMGVIALNVGKILQERTQRLTMQRTRGEHSDGALGNGIQNLILIPVQTQVVS